MKDKSTLNAVEFLILGIFWSAIVNSWYKSLLFRIIEPLTYGQCKNLLWAMILLSVLLGAFLTCRYDKNFWSVACCIGLPFGIYTSIAYKVFIGKKLDRTLQISLVLILVYVLLIVCRKVKRRKNLRRVIKARLYKCLHGTYTIFAVAMLYIGLSMSLPVFFGEAIFSSSVAAARPEAGKEETIENHQDTILKLKEWDELDSVEKLDILQEIANIEASGRWGIHHELNICAEEMDESQLGYYYDRNHEIYLNLQYLEEAPLEETLDCLFHESFHAYSHRLVDLYHNTAEEYKNLMLFEDVVVYDEEYSDYIDGQSLMTFEEYYEQKCEEHARYWGQRLSSEYMQRLSQLSAQ